MEPSPFGTLESSYHYVRLLIAAVAEAQRTVGIDIADVEGAGGGRRHEALQLVSYKLTQLDQYLTASRRILKDLRTLRRFLEGERSLGNLGRQRPAAATGP